MCRAPRGIPHSPFSFYSKTICISLRYSVLGSRFPVLGSIFLFLGARITCALNKTKMRWQSVGPGTEPKTPIGGGGTSSRRGVARHKQKQRQLAAMTTMAMVMATLATAKATLVQYSAPKRVSLFFTDRKKYYDKVCPETCFKKRVFCESVPVSHAEVERNLLETI